MTLAEFQAALADDVAEDANTASFGRRLQRGRAYDRAFREIRVQRLWVAKEVLSADGPGRVIGFDYGREVRLNDRQERVFQTEGCVVPGRLLGARVRLHATRDARRYAIDRIMPNEFGPFATVDAPAPADRTRPTFEELSQRALKAWATRRQRGYVRPSEAREDIPCPF